MLPFLAVPFAWLPAVAPVQALPAALSTEVPALPVDSSLAESPCGTFTVDGTCLPNPRCAQGSMDLGGMCIPTGGSLNGEETLGGDLIANAHVDRMGRRVTYLQLPRQQNLPAAYNRYVYPVGAGREVASGYDLDRPDELQRRGATLHAVGHGGVDLPGVRGEPIRVISLRGETADPEVVYVGPLFGNTVVLRHIVREGSALRTYLAIHGHLDAPAPGIVRGLTVRPGTVLGTMGDSESMGFVHLHYETRLVRPGVDPMSVESPRRLVDQEVSVPCDPRNVLPMH